ncbi:MAG: universal stress protein [Thermovirgaceae bacterium]|nr:universal stress protein [Thermovirgaceae bacterium]
MICSLERLKELGTKDAVFINCFNIRDVGTLAPGLMELSRPAFEKQKKLLEDMGFKVTAEMVLVLRLNGDENGQSEAPTCNFFGHILFPTDFSDNAERAFAFVEKFAKSGAKKITLFHVQDKEKIDACRRTAIMSPL